MKPGAMYSMAGVEIDPAADLDREIHRLRRKRDDLASRLDKHNPDNRVPGVTKLRVRLEQACHDLMELELKP